MLTPAVHQAIRQAALRHEEAVRALVFDQFTAEQVHTVYRVRNPQCAGARHPKILIKPRRIPDR